MKAVSGQVKSFGGVIQKNSAQIKKMGRQMTMAGAAIIGTVGLMVKAYGSFDEAMVRSLAIMGDVSLAMRKEMAKTAKQLSTETTFAAKELAEAYYFLASAGMNAEQSISALAPVARFAQAGTFDLALATDLLTDAQTALGLSTKDVIQNEENLIRVSDVLVGANTLANASVLQFSEALTNKAAAALVNLNKEVEEGVAVLAAYADKGVKGRLAGTRLTMMLNGLFAATRENKEAWDEAGISLFEADESMRSIADIIQDMEGYLGNMTVKQREATLATLGFNIKTKDSILTLMGSSEKMKEWTENLKDMGGITKEVADKQLEAFNAKMKILGNTVKNTAITMGQLFVPMVEKVAKKIGKAAEKTSEWAEAHEDLAGVLATSVAALGGTLLALGGIGMALPKIIAGLKILKVAAVTGFGAVTIGAGLAFVATKLLEKFRIGPIFRTEELDEQTKAYKKQIEAIGMWSDFEDAAVRAQIASREDLIAIWDKYEQNTQEAFKAITEGAEGVSLQEFFAELIRGHKVVASWATGIAKMFEAVRKKVAKVPAATAEGLKDTIPVYDLWATRVAQIFHDTSVRAAQMQGVIERKIVIPPMAVEIPKMSLKDLRDYYIKWLADLKASWKSAWQVALAESRNVVSALDSLFGQFAENQAARLDNEEKKQTDFIEGWYEQRRAAIEATIMDEEAKVAALEALDEEKARHENKLQHRMDKERRKLARQEAKAEKVSALFSAGINLAEAITKAFAQGGPIFGSIMAGIVAGLIAIQIAAIAAAPLPALQRGGRIEEAGIVGEAGPELFLPRAPGTIVPLRTEATPLSTQPRITMTFLGPLISTTGVARADLIRAGSTLFDIMEREARRRGYEFV